MPNDQNSTLEVERLAFESQKPTLLAAHAGKYALVRNAKVEGVFDTLQAAYHEGIQRFGAVPFFVGHIVDVEPPQSVPALQHGVIHAYI